jgi:hypothetical protein
VRARAQARGFTRIKSSAQHPAGAKCGADTDPFAHPRVCGTKSRV